MISPLTGRNVITHPFEAVDSHDFPEDDTIGRWAVTDGLYSAGFKLGGQLTLGQATLTDGETRAVLALARSYAWEAARRKAKPPIFMSQEGKNYVEAAGKLSDGTLSAWRVVVAEDLRSEARLLGLEEKSARTLANLALAEEKPGVGVPLAIVITGYPGTIGTPQGEYASPAGLAYGCQDDEALIVFHLLVDRGLILVKPKASPGVSSRVRLTPEGYLRAEDAARGRSDVARRGFLICRFNDLMDGMYETVYEQAGDHEDLRCPIRRVKDIHFVETIDDRIVHEIRSATVIMVDLTDHNFNVAFEAGYALALGKPIVWTKKRGGRTLKLPFDIQSHNIMVWKDDELDRFAEDLHYRLLAALEKAEAR